MLGKTALASAALLVLASGWGALTATANPAVAIADSRTDPFLDSDGDLLPDTLEWVALSHPGKVDTDDDDADDFLEVVQHSSPIFQGSPKPLDHEMRILVHATDSSQPSGGHAWVNFLFRFAGSGIGDLKVFQPYLYWNGAEYPVWGLLSGSPSSFSYQYVPGQGFYAALTVRLCSARELRQILPCTIGARAVIGQKPLVSGTYLRDVAGYTAAMLPLAENSGRPTFLFQLLDGQDLPQDPFFDRNKVCELELEVIGTGNAGHLCEVTNAECEPANGLSCNLDCASARGETVFIPDGLVTITGG